jgi:hypothetical protein
MSSADAGVVARIRARALVVQATADTVVDSANGKLLADRIPGDRRAAAAYQSGRAS